MLTIGLWTQQAELGRRDSIKPVPWSVNISTVITIDESALPPKDIISVKDLQPANSIDETNIVIIYPNITNLVHTAIIVIENRCILDLYNGSKAVILYKRIIVIARIKAKIHIGIRKPNINIRPIVRDKEIKLTILKYRKLNAIYHKDKRLCLIKVPVI